jgi:hypothetical protein
MALVRCTCVVDLRLLGDDHVLRVLLADPTCTFLPHRALHDLEPLPAG